MKMISALILAVFANLALSAPAQAVCLTIFENPQNLPDSCRLQITNYFRYYRKWTAGSCNAIYSYKMTSPNTVELKYTENFCDARITLQIQITKDACYVEKALTPFSDTANCQSR